MAGPDRPHRLVGEHEPRMRLEHRELATEDGLGLAAASLLDRLADAGDDAQAGCEGTAHPQPDRLVALTEVLPPFGMPHQRTGDAELEEHRRGDLAGVCALLVPVDVLRVRRQTRLDASA